MEDFILGTPQKKKCKFRKSIKTTEGQLKRALEFVEKNMEASDKTDSIATASDDDNSEARTKQKSKHVGKDAKKKNLSRGSNFRRQLQQLYKTSEEEENERLNGYLNVENLEKRMNATRRAERAVENDDCNDQPQGRGSDSPQESSLQTLPMQEQPRSRQKMTKNIVAKIKNNAKRLKEERKKQNNESKVKDLLVKYLGSEDAVIEGYSGKKRFYIYKCPDCSKFFQEKLARHRKDKHGVDLDEGALNQSKMKTFFLWCRTSKHNTPYPGPCIKCSKWFLRIDHHLMNTCRYNTHLTELQKSDLVRQIKAKYWFKNYDSCSNQESRECMEASLDDVNEENCIDTDNDFDNDTGKQPQTFSYRSKTLNVPNHCSNSIGINYIPEGANRLEESHFKKYNISKDDFFTIYYPDADSLLNAFYKFRVDGNDTKENGLQHRNKVEGIWSVLDKEMKQFPVNALGNLHLLRDFYHIPVFKQIGKKDGVQGGTLRSRYTSMLFFISFLRRQQIFAGLSRNQLKALETTIADFNKELNPSIKQRSVDVRQQKLRNLLTPAHFIKYGKSNYIQSLLKPFFEYEKTKVLNNKIFNKKFAIRFGDYLMCMMVIGNGLRASNVMEITVNDVLSAQTSDQYPHHRIITNTTYKTSTIYGEKFIVLPEIVYRQYMFFLNHLRDYIIIGRKSKFFFVPSSDRAKCNQTNITSKMSASFKLAKVFSNNEYNRVCCTRIRCAIATFACNEGGFEEGFIAKHFMKNREETTSKHYNLLSNRRHALNIAMSLYQNFMDVSISNTHVEEISKEINERIPCKEAVLNWIMKHDSLSKKEIADIKSILSELDAKSSGKKCQIFYGNKICSSKEVSCDTESNLDAVLDDDGIVETENMEDEPGSSSTGTTMETAVDFAIPRQANKKCEELQELAVEKLVLVREYPRRRRHKINVNYEIDVAKMFCDKEDQYDWFKKIFIDSKIGYGIFALKDIEAKQYLMTYKGNLLTEEKGDELEQVYEESGAGCYLYFFKHGKQSLCVDATNTDGLCRYVNDSAAVNANCVMEMIVKNNTPYLCLFASEHIEAGVELRYSYGESNKKLWWRNSETYGCPFTFQNLNSEAAKVLSAHVKDNVPVDNLSNERKFCKKTVTLREDSSDDEWVPEKTRRTNARLKNQSNDSCKDRDIEKTPKGKIRKRKGAFTEKELKIIRKKCKSFYHGRVMNERNICEAVAGTNLLHKHSWKQIRSKITYER